MRNHTMRRIAIIAAIPSLLLLWAMVAAQKPAVIGCVDLERVFAGLDQHKAGEARLQDLLKAEVSELSAALRGAGLSGRYGVTEPTRSGRCRRQCPA